MLNRFNKEDVFHVPNVLRLDELYCEPPAVRRHYLVIAQAMRDKDNKRVGNRQARLLRSGFEIPTTLSQCEKLLEKYEDATETS